MRLAAVLLLLWHLHLSAQVTPDDLFRFRVGQWTPEGFQISSFRNETLRVQKGRARLLAEPVLPESQRPKQPGPNLPAVAPKPKRDGGKVLFAHGRNFFTALERGEIQAAVLWEDLPDQGWTPTARMAYVPKRRGYHTPPSLFPLGNGKVLVLNPDPPEGWKDPDTCAPFAVFRRNDRDELSLSTEIEAGIPKWKASTTLRMDFGFLDATTIVGDLLVVGGWRYGLFWVFDLEDGRLKRLIRLQDAVTDEDITQARKLEVLIHYQPRKDGTLLVAARPEDATRALGKALEKLDAKTRLIADTGSDPVQTLEAYQWAQRERELITVEFPFVHWLEVDPATGSRRRLEVPPTGAKEMLTTRQELNDFYWIPDEAGNLRTTRRDLQDLRREDEPKPRTDKDPAPKPKPAPKPAS